MIATTPRNSISKLMAFDPPEDAANEDSPTLPTFAKCSSSGEPLEVQFSTPLGDFDEIESLKGDISLHGSDGPAEENSSGSENEKDSSHESSSSASKSNSKRSDIELKYSIRALRKYFRDHFRTHHARLINRRIVNCNPKEVYTAVEELLTDFLEVPDCDKDLVFYLIGILALKQVNRMACSKTVKREVKEFLD